LCRRKQFKGLTIVAIRQVLERHRPSTFGDLRDNCPAPSDNACERRPIGVC
jgi:hypothetical protein